LKDYPPQDATGSLQEAYGPRLKGTGEFGYNIDQIKRVVEKLRKKPDTRRAAITLLESSDLEPSQKEAPCTIGLQFIRRRERLHLVAMMRSNDAYLGFPHDVFCFTMIQELVARSLGIKVGDYHHFATSLHLYENDRDPVATYLGEGFQSPVFSMPKMPSGCQMEHLAAFLGVESAIRQGDIVEAGQISLPKYWRDLSLVLLRCADLRYEREATVLDENFAQIEDPFYKNFFVKRPQILPKGEVQKMVQDNLDLGEEQANEN
jgi:thymidylate synthase